MMTSMANRAPQLIASVALVLTAMSGCVSERDRGVEAETCVSWADLSDAQVAFDEADAVIIGRSSASTDVTSMFGLDAAVHDVEVLQVLKGDVVGTVAGRCQFFCVRSRSISLSAGWSEGESVGELDGESVQRLVPSLGAGSELSTAMGLDVPDA